MIPRREPRQQKSTKRTGHKVVFILGTVLLVGICTVAMLAGLFMMYVRTTLAPTLEVNADDYTMNLSSIIYYQDRDTGDWVEYQTVYGTENRIWVDYEQIPDALWQAAVAIEDHRFFEHNGVDWTRTASATLNFFTGSRATFGGSTLTQQVLKNMTGDDGNTINRKVREIFRALEFEKNYTKQEILEMYLNTIYLGQGCYGVQTASEFYFGKDVSELDPAECACLIAITNNPSLYGPMSTITITREDGSTVTPREANKERQEMILTRMAGGNDDVGVTGLTYLTEEEAEAAKAEELHFTDGTTSAQDIVTEATGGANVNSWFVDQVLRDVSADLADLYGITEKEALNRIYNSGYNIYTTLDPKIQEIAESVYEDRGSLNNLTSASGQLIHSGITIIEPSTGNIVAMVGDMGPKSGNLLWNYATDIQQPGSSIKPLTAYAPALDAGAVSPATTFDNYPVRLLNGNPWPKNSPNTYTGWTSVRNGVKASINTIAVQTLEKVGVTAAYQFATENLGLSLAPEDMNVSPLGLPAGVAAAITAALPMADRYPDPLCRALRTKLAAAEGVDTAQILCGNGAADLIYRLALALRPRRALLPAPTFAEYAAALETVDCDVQRFLLREENDFAVTDGFVDAIDDSTDAVFLCQPNNPTGQVTPLVMVQKLLRRCADCGAVLVVDECFLDFLAARDALTAKTVLRDAPNLIILKAFTKLYAMAGVRLGYALCSDTALLDKMRTAGQPWAVSGLAQAAGLAALEETAYADSVRTLIADQRPRLAAGLRALGLRVVDGQANYLLFRAPADFGAKLRRHGAVVRGCGNYPGLDETWYRTAVRTQKENEQLLKIMREVLE